MAPPGSSELQGFSPHSVASRESLKAEHFKYAHFDAPCFQCLVCVLAIYAATSASPFSATVQPRAYKRPTGLVLGFKFRVRGRCLLGMPNGSDGCMIIYS